jgi:hypothetical protein
VNAGNPNIYEYPLLIPGFFELNIPFVKANLRDLAQCTLESLTIEVSLMWHVQYPRRLVEPQNSDLCHETIEQKILMLGAGALLLDDGLRLGDPPDTLPYFTMYSLCCQATLILPKPQAFGCPLTDSNASVLGLDLDL